MPLTPEDVSNKRFTPVRLREGYDMGEVDQFLDEVEAELARLTRENDDLRAKLSAAQSGAVDSAPAPMPEPPAPEPVVRPTPEPEPEPVPTQQTPAVGALAAGVETIRVETVGDASNAAARLLELASRNADQLVEDAKSEADKIVGEARTKAERLEGESKTNADRSRPTPAAAPSCWTPRPPSAARSCSATSSASATRSPTRSTTCGPSSASTARASRRYFSQQLEALESSASADPTTHEAGLSAAEAAALGPRRRRGLTDLRDVAAGRPSRVPAVRRASPAPRGEDDGVMPGCRASFARRACFEWTRRGLYPPSHARHPA